MDVDTASTGNEPRPTDRGANRGWTHPTERFKGVERDGLSVGRESCRPQG